MRRARHMSYSIHGTARRLTPLWIAALLVGFGSWLQVAPAQAAPVGWLILPGANLATAQALQISSFPSSSTSPISVTGGLPTPSTTGKLKVVVKGKSRLLYAAKLRHTTISPYIVKLGTGGQYDREHPTGTVTGYSTSGSGSTAQTTVTFTISLTGVAGDPIKSCTATRFGAAAGCVLPASHLIIGSKSLSPAHGTAIGFAVLATDVLGQRVRGYTGTVHFTSTSPATLPADYTFTSGDAGLHVFKRVIFPSAGANTVTARDTGAANTFGKRTFNVT
jgi:hypothetical protein